MYIFSRQKIMIFLSSLLHASNIFHIYNVFWITGKSFFFLCLCYIHIIFLLRSFSLFLYMYGEENIREISWREKYPEVSRFFFLYYRHYRFFSIMMERKITTPSAVYESKDVLSLFISMTWIDSILWYLSFFKENFDIHFLDGFHCI